MHVIGTAGHVDHGKSTLIEALTGINPDHLKEERDREMTIDLGFAWMQMPDGEMVGIVDVPGGINVSGFRDRFHTNRKYALAFLEYLDRKGITLRTGDRRVLKR